MKVRKYQATEEKAVLTALIVHDRILGRITAELGQSRSPFRNKWSNIIVQWCFSHYSKYHKAPRRHIEDYFRKWSQSEGDEESSAIIESFLSHLNENYRQTAQEMNEAYLVDLAGRFFTKVRLESLSDKIQRAIEKNDVEEAEALQLKFKSVNLSSKSPAGSNPFSPKKVMEVLHWEQEDRSIIRFPGALGTFLSPHFERDGFIAFAAPEKKGKSYWLLEVVWQALRQRRKVLYYVIGDMSERQALARLYRRATRRPRRTKQIRFPISIKPGIKDQAGVLQADVQNEERVIEGITFSAIKKAVQKLKTQTASKKINLKLICAGASMLSASAIEENVKGLAQQGWVPDVVIIDYADLLASEDESMKLDYRHQINETWKILRRISSEQHVLLVTATQAAARAYDQWVLRKKDFSEDKRKNAHTTGTLGINQTAEEKKLGIYRLNWVFLRDGEWSDNQVVWVAGNLALASPCLKSSL